MFLRKPIQALVIFLWILLLPLSVMAQNSMEQPEAMVTADKVEQVQELTPLSIFYRDDCKHCHDAVEYLTPLVEERGDFELRILDLADEKNTILFNEIAELEGLTKSTPIIVVGNTVVQGFDKPETTGVMLLSLLDASKGQGTMTAEAYVSAGGSSNDVQTVDGGVCDEEGCTVTETPFLVSVPFMGEIDVKQFSLPVMALVLGFIDGFNPCAMWVLVTFLIVLMQVGDRKKMWQIAGLFILAEAVMYYMILNVWFTAWDFIGLDRIVTPIIGLIAIGGGIFFLYEWRKSDGTCQVTNLEQRSKINSKIKEIASKPMTLVTAGGVIALALSVNIIEFACSIGIPQAFTKVIELNALSWLHTQFLMFLYILMYMVDDFIVFGFALWGAQHLAMTTKYTKWSNFIGGILMIILGGLLIFAPDLLRM